MRKDTRFARHSHEELTEKLPPGTLADPQAAGIWQFFLRSDDPSGVAHQYRSYRDSDRCAVPREKLRAMRDTMVESMREMNKKDPTRRTETQVGRNTAGHNDGFMPMRRGS
jgi:hypothetical protein